MPDDNPLLTIHIPIPFDRIQPDHVAPAIGSLIARAQGQIDEIASLAEPRTWTNTMARFDNAGEELGFAMTVVHHLESVAATPALREAWTAAQPAAVEFISSIPLHPGLWRAMREFAATQEASQLSGPPARFLRKTMDGFRRQGAELDEAGKARLREIDIELATVATQFARNVIDATAAFEYLVEDGAALAGLPESAIDAAAQSARQKEKTGWRFTLQQPSYFAVLTYLDDANVREHFWRAYNRRAAEANAVLIPRLLTLRQERARLLGFPHFAALVLAERMAKTGEAALKFVGDLRRRTEAAFHRENAELLAFRRSIEGPDAALHPWDVSYWAEKQRKAEYDFDEEDLRPYFPLDQVLSGLFSLVKRLYGVTVTPAGPVPQWHPSVTFYELREQGGGLLGSFYADWFPRENKRDGAWMNAFVTGGPLPDGVQPHVGLMAGNLPEPVNGKPSLLTHRDVETIFHEFGHLLHHLLSKVEIKGMAGTNVAWDFVELPSQIMENWCWERESLDLFARHWQTGAPLPEELFARMRRARNFRSANGQMRQLGFATIDLLLHTGFDAQAHPDVLAYANSVLQEFAPAPLPPENAMLASFTHLFADAVGYAAGYYSYKWAEVLDADAFTRFQREGIFNAETGLAFRECILSKGDSEDPASLFRSFMGRDPDPAALLARLGLTEASHV